MDILRPKVIQKCGVTKWLSTLWSFSILVNGDMLKMDSSAHTWHTVWCKASADLCWLFPTIRLTSLTPQWPGWRPLHQREGREGNSCVGYLTRVGKDRGTSKSDKSNKQHFTRFPPPLLIPQSSLVYLLNEDGIVSTLSCVNKAEEAKRSMTKKVFNLCLNLRLIS